MKKVSVALISVACVCSLLLCTVCLMRSLPDSYYFFVDRWASDPDWSPGGEELAFTCHYPSLSQVWEDRGEGLFHWGYIYEGTEICTVQPDGSDLVRLTDNQAGDMYPSWSPDGKLIAYLSGSGTDRVIRIIEAADGSLLTEFAEDLDILLGKPIWSPDGGRVCISARNPLQPDQGDNLYVAVLESRQVYALTTLSGDELECSWTPDGTRLALAWFPDGYRALGSKNAAIRIVDVEGHHGMTLVEGFAGVGDLTWNPDGTQISFWAYSSADCAYDCAEVYVAGLDSSIECLTDEYEMDFNFEAAWSPDGEQIAFTATAPKGSGIYAVAPSGGRLSWIAPAAPSAHSFDWSPNGETIAFVEGIEGEKDRIWFANVRTGELSELAVP